MVNSLLAPLRRWPALGAAVNRIKDALTRPGSDLDWEHAMNEPESFEMSFMALHTEGRFDEMWDMVAEDAQRAWGDRDAFVRGMPRLGDGTELLDVQVIDVRVLDSWTDMSHDRSYSNVAQMKMRYRVRQQWGDWSFDRQVHLVPGASGWRTLCYPANTVSQP